MNRYLLMNSGINASEGIKRFNGNAELYEKFLREFPEDKHFMEMISAIESENVQDAFTSAHALKGIAGNLSLNELYEAINPLVELFRTGSLDNAGELLQPVLESYDKIISGLQQLYPPQAE